MEVIRRKKLIEVALPLDDINVASAKEKEPFGVGPHPRSLHHWWARRPFASARAVIFAQMVDDPSAVPEEFPTSEAQQKERERLFQIIRDFVPWKNASDEKIIARARQEIRRSWKRCCEDNKNHPEAAVMFNPDVLPAFQDPFAGGGAMPFEAQRLGLESYASDLNPIPVLINKAMIEIPPQFADMPPVNPEARKTKSLIEKEWKGVEGLISDIEYYGQRVHEKAVERMGHLYPDVHVTEKMVNRRPDLAPYKGQNLEVLTYIWARTVRSPNPAFSHVDVPLISTYWLCKKKGKEVFLEPIVEGENYRFEIRFGRPESDTVSTSGTKPKGSGSSFECILSGTPMPFDFLRSKAKSEGLGKRLIAVVCKGKRGKVYINAEDAPTVEGTFQSIKFPRLPEKALGFRVQGYGMESWDELYSDRQLHCLLSLSDIIKETSEEIKVASKKLDSSEIFESYHDSVSLYLSFALARVASFNSTLCRWSAVGEWAVQVFARHALPMTWDYSETMLLSSVGLGWSPSVKAIAKHLRGVNSNVVIQGKGAQKNATDIGWAKNKIVVTDPPYYDNIGYADLSDYFYVWHRRTLGEAFGDILGTMSTPKSEELIASPYRHGSREQAEEFFMDGMSVFMRDALEASHPAFPISIYYAFKQKEVSSGDLENSVGWCAFLEAVIGSGYQLTATIPLATERKKRMIASGTNALASSVVLVCNRRSENSLSIERSEFVEELKTTLPGALEQLVKANTAPVDMAQAAIGPGMAVFSKYSSITKLSGEPMTVREALALINEVLDESLSAREADYDEDTRWATAWFSQFGFAEGEFGIADQLARAKNTSVEGVVLAGLASSSRGTVKLYRPEELPADWDPRTDGRLTMWERTNHLVRALMKGGDSDAAVLLKRMGSAGQEARDLAYQLYNVCEKNKWSKEALGYNALIQGWPEIERLAKSEYIDLGDGGTLFDNIDNN